MELHLKSWDSPHSLPPILTKSTHSFLAPVPILALNIKKRNIVINPMAIFQSAKKPAKVAKLVKIPKATETQPGEAGTGKAIPSRVTEKKSAVIQLVDSAIISAEYLHKFNVVSLKAYVLEKNMKDAKGKLLKTSGKKDELIQRILEHTHVLKVSRAVPVKVLCQTKKIAEAANANKAEPIEKYETFSSDEEEDGFLSLAWQPAKTVAIKEAELLKDIDPFSSDEDAEDDELSYAWHPTDTAVVSEAKVLKEIDPFSSDDDAEDAPRCSPMKRF